MAVVARRAVPEFQTRVVSERAVYADTVEAFSETFLNSIRRICLPILEKLCVDQEKVSMTVSVEQVDEAMGFAIEAMRRRGVAEVQKLGEALRPYFETGLTILASQTEIQRNAGLFFDDRLSNWMGLTQTRTLIRFERDSGTTLVEIPKEIRSISCFRYALLMAGIDVQGNLTQERLFSILFELGYEPVSDLQDGDLVLFFKWGNPVHLGLCREGKILSKEGNSCPFAYLKNLQDLSPQYGTEVLYYRTEKARS